MLQKMAQHSNFQKLSDTAIIKKIYYIILPKSAFFTIASPSVMARDIDSIHPATIEKGFQHQQYLSC
jgi:hypothetical protein